MWPCYAFVNAIGVAVANVSAANVTVAVGVIVMVPALSLSALLFRLLPMLMLSVANSVAARDAESAGAVVVAAIDGDFTVMNVAIADSTVAGYVFVNVRTTGVDSKGRVRDVGRVRLIIAVLAKSVIDGGIGNTGLKWRGAARKRSTYGRSRVSLVQEVAFASITMN